MRSLHHAAVFTTATPRRAAAAMLQSCAAARPVPAGRILRTTAFQVAALVSTESTPKPAKKPLPAPATLSLLRQYLGIEEKTSEVFESIEPLDPVFIAVDLEAYEFNQRKISEVGVATLDSRHLPPLSGTSPERWFCQIRTNHYLMKGYQKYINKKHVKGCPDKFLFGHSQYRVLTKVIPSILKDEFTIPDVKDEWNTANRNIVLVGHNINGDIKYLNTIGFALSRQNLVGLVDTEKLAQAIKLPQGLRRLLLAMGEEPEYLHNAGNDAHYTMQAALLMALYGHVLPVPPVMDAARQTILEREQAQKAEKEKAAAAKKAKMLKREEERKNETEAEKEDRLEAHRARLADQVEAKKMKKKGGRGRADKAISEEVKKIKEAKKVEKAQAYEASLEECRARSEEYTPEGG